MAKSRKPAFCPRCGSPETTRVTTGWPTPELGQKTPVKGPPLARLLGVDVVDRVCNKCGHQWLTRPAR